MDASELYRNQMFVCNVSVQRPASGAVVLVTTPSQPELTPESEDVYHLRHRGRNFRVFIVDNFTFGPETRLQIEIGQQEF